MREEPSAGAKRRHVKLAEGPSLRHSPYGSHSRPSDSHSAALNRDPNSSLLFVLSRATGPDSLILERPATQSVHVVLIIVRPDRCQVSVWVRSGGGSNALSARFEEGDWVRRDDRGGSKQR